MGLYDERLAALNEPRRVPPRRPFAPAETRASHAPAPPPALRSAAKATAKPRKSTHVQSLLFDRDAGWTVEQAKSWAKRRGFKSGDVDVTDRYIHMRQFNPKGLKVKRTVTFGRGIRAVVAREGDMAAKRTTTKETRRQHRRTREAPKTAEARRRRAPRRGLVMESRRGESVSKRSKAAKKGWAKRRRAHRTHVRETRVAAPVRRAPPVRRVSETRRRRRHAREAWRGDVSGHSSAAKKGWAKRRQRRHVREAWRGDTARHSAAAKKGWSKRRRKSGGGHRRRRTRESTAYEALIGEMRETRRPRRRYHRSTSVAESAGAKVAELTLALLAGGLGFVLTDGVDRFLATYDPAAATKPTDKFTSDGAGTLANALNVASPPGLARIGAAVGLTALPAIGSVFVDHPFLKSSLQGWTVGSGVKLFSLFWNSVLVPLLKPKDTSNAGLQKSFIARLYPAEISASINLHQQPPTTAVSTGGAAGALSGPADVGPFALSSPGEDFATVAQALRRQAGMADQFPTLQNTWGTGAQSTPGEPPGLADRAFGDIARTISSFFPGLPLEHAFRAASQTAAEPYDIYGSLYRTFPSVPPETLQQCARYVQPHVSRLSALQQAGYGGWPWRPAPPGVSQAAADAGAAPAAPTNGGAAPPPPPPPPTNGGGAVAPPPPPPPPAPAPAVAPPPPAPAPPPAWQPQLAQGGWQPGPPIPPGPGPQGPRIEPTAPACACLGDGDQYLGFIGDAQEDPLFFSSAGK